MKNLILILCLIATPCFADHIRKILVEPVPATQTVTPKGTIDTEAYAKVTVYSTDQEGSAETINLKGGDLALVKAITDTEVGVVRFWIHFNEVARDHFAIIATPTIVKEETNVYDKEDPELIVDVITVEKTVVVDVLTKTKTSAQWSVEKLDFTLSPYAQKVVKELGNDLSQAITALKNKLEN